MLEIKNFKSEYTARKHAENLLMMMKRANTF